VQEPSTTDTKIEESLKEVNTQLGKEIKQLEFQISQHSVQIEQLEETNRNLQTEIQSITERNSVSMQEANDKFNQQLTDLSETREKEILDFKTDLQKVNEENENVSDNFFFYFLRIINLKICLF
jgi:predicted  nucleic acid-binding Zn-ribbon protein